MLISPELLRLHTEVTWQQEFGLQSYSLEDLVQPYFSQVATLLGATGAHVCMFEKRDPTRFYVGKKLSHANTFDSLRKLLKRHATHTVISENDNESALSNLSKDADKDSIKECFIVTFAAKNEQIDGFVCFYAEEINPKNIDLHALAQMLQSNVCNSLLLKKAKRINVDQQEFYALVADTNTVNIFAKDADSKIVFCNQSFLNLYPPEKRDKVLGYTTVEEYDETQREIFLQDDRDAFASGFKSLVEVIDFPNGKQITLETTKIRFTTRSSNDYILCVAYDLSKQYKLIKELENKNKDLDKIANVLATDLRAPANAMVNLIKWLEQDLKSIDNDEVHELLGELRKRSTKINRLLSIVYKYAFAGRDKHISTQFALTKTVADILSDANIQKNVTSSISDVVLHLPRSPFVEVLTNLIINAYEHHPHDDVKLIVNVKSDKKHYEIDIIDDGNGIDIAVADTIFELFSTSKDSQESEVFGVGLAIAKRIVQSYDGKLFVDTQHSNGTKMTIIWPKSAKN